MSQIRRSLFLSTSIMMLCLAVPASAQEPASLSDLHGSLRDVINRGAKIYNENGDFAGCYRVFEGTLVAIRPVLDADLQKEIDGAFAKANRMASYSDKAFELRRALDRIRDRVGPEKKSPDGEKLGDPKKSKIDGPDKEKLGEPKKSKEEKKTKTEKKAKADVVGNVILDGKPLEKGMITLLNDKGEPRYAVNIEKGRYKFGNIDAGKYRIVVQSPKKGAETLPPRYSNADNTTLTFDVSAGKSNFDLELRSK